MRISDWSSDVCSSDLSCWFQQSLNELGASPRLKVDCKIGPRSVAALRPELCVAMLDKMDARQTAEYQRLVRVNPKLKVFYRGWINKRVGNVDRKKCSTRSEEHTSELQSLMRISYAVFCLK